MNRYLILVKHEGNAASWLLQTGALATSSRRNAVEDYGGKAIDDMLLLGEYEQALTVEFPDHAACLAFVQALTAWGSKVSTLPVVSDKTDEGAEKARSYAASAASAVIARLEGAPPAGRDEAPVPTE